MLHVWKLWTKKSLVQGGDIPAAGGNGISLEKHTQNVPTICLFASVLADAWQYARTGAMQRQGTLTWTTAKATTKNKHGLKLPPDRWTKAREGSFCISEFAFLRTAAVWKTWDCLWCLAQKGSGVFYSEVVPCRVNPVELLHRRGRTSSVTGRLEFNQGQISRGMIGKIYWLRCDIYCITLH